MHYSAMWKINPLDTSTRLKETQQFSYMKDWLDALKDDKLIYVLDDF